VKRPANERKKLPPELEAFARSQDEKLRVTRPRVDRGRVNDPREGYTIAGVANRDGRSVYDSRSEAMRALWADGKAGEAALLELGQLLHDAQRLVLWRARRLTGFDAFAEEVVGVPAKRGQELVDAHTAASGEAPTELSERNVAAWLRTEAGAYEGDERARARISSTPHGMKLVLTVSLAGASLALAGVGNRHAPLAREQEGGAPEAPRRSEPRMPVRAPEPAASEPARLTSERAPEGGRQPAGARLLTRKRSREGVADDSIEGADGAAEEAAPERPARAARAELASSRDRQAPRDRSEKRPSFGAKPFGARSQGAEPRAFGNKGSYADKRGFDDKRGGGEKRSFGAKPAFSTKPAFGAKPAYGAKAGFGDKRGFGDKPAAGARAERPAFAGKRGTGDRGARASFGEKRPFGERGGQGGGQGGGFRSGGQGGGFKGGGQGGGDFKGGGFKSGGAKRPFEKRPAGGGKGFAGKGFAGKGDGGKKGGFAERPAAKSARQDDAGDE